MVAINGNVEEDDLLGGGVAERGVSEAAEILLLVLHEEPIDVAATDQPIACRDEDVSAQSESRPPSTTQADWTSSVTKQSIKHFLF